MKELREVVGFPGYLVNRIGQVFSCKRKKMKLLNQTRTVNGYLKVNLCRDGEVYNRKIHRLVAEAFIPNPLGLSQVNHIDEDKTNNRVENLEWVTPKQNSNYGTRTERSAEANVNNPKRSKPVVAYTYKGGEYYGEYPSVNEAARQLGLNHGSIIKCCKGKKKHTGEFVFVYKDTLLV